MPSRRSLALLVFITAALMGPSAASAATLTVDDDRAQCPGAQFTKIQPAIDASNNGDTVAICPGTYVEGSGGTGSNALTIANKNIDLRGAGADLVAIQPKRSTATGGQIADPTLDLRNGFGDIISIVGTRTFPTTVNVSGVTVDGNGVYVEAGVVYRDAGGQLLRSRVTNVVTSESNTADTLAGGYRSGFPGIGVAQVTLGGSAGTFPTRPALSIVQSRISRYNRVGVLIDAATGDTAPLTPAAAGAPAVATLSGTQIVGRTQCTAFNTPTPPPYVLGGPFATPALQLPGNCATVSPTTVGPTFGQDGVRVTAGSSAQITDSTITANLVQGTGAPAYGSATNNANLTQAAGVRAIGAAASTVSRSNLNDNAYGVFNTQLDGTTANTATPVVAENDFWGLRVNAPSNTGPAISPATNPAYQETAVNGTASTTDTSCTSSAGAAQPNSTAVDFCPYRNGNQADPTLGQLPVAYAPLPVDDGGPSVQLTTDKDVYNRGDTVTLTAAATDDFWIAKVTFYDGTTPIGTAIPPASSATLAIPADAACTSRTLTAVAQDSIGQTASGSRKITVTGPDDCATVEPTPTPTGTTPSPTTTPAAASAPTIVLSGVGSSMPAGGATARAAVTVDPAVTVARVAFKLGTRTVCADTTAPYTCSILPRGRETGLQTVLATVTDSRGQSATDSTATRVIRFRSAVSVGVKRKTTRRRFVRTVRGRVVPSSKRASRKVACASGTVTVTVTRNGRTVLPLTQVGLQRNCSYKLRLKTRRTRRHAFRAVVRFGGNKVLLPARTTRRFK